MAVPTTATGLVKKALKVGDAYCAAAVYSIADSMQRNVLRSLMFGKRRDALMLARWEHTPPEVLQAISHHRNDADSALTTRLRKNPGMPSAALSGLYVKEAENGSKVVNDPALTLLIARHQHTPIDVLEDIAKLDDIEILKAVCNNPVTDSQLLRLLVARKPGVLDRNVVTNPSAPADLLEQIYLQAYATDDAYLRAAIIAHAHCPTALIDGVAADDDPIVLRQLAGDEHIGADVLAHLVDHDDAAVRCAAAANARLTPKQLKLLLKDKSSAVRRIVASRLDLSAVFIRHLMTDADHWVRLWLGRNPVLPPKVMRILATDAHVDVRRAIARNPRCPVVLLEMLAVDKHAWVRSAVAYQQRAPRRLMNLLAQDTDIDVLSGVASNPHTPLPVLLKLAASPEADVRRGVILNRQTKRRTLLALLDDPYYLHRILLASSPKLKLKDKWPLCDDPDAQVRFSAFRSLAKSLAITEIPIKNSISTDQERH